MKKYSREDQRVLAIWAVKCAKRVLPLFEKKYPKDSRPRKALEACRAWIKTGIFSMKVIRKASLDSHKAARRANEGEAAHFAAHATGQAVGTAHVTQHAFGASIYALKAVAEANPNTAEQRAIKELKWQAERLPQGIRRKFLGMITIQKIGSRIKIGLKKGEDF